MTVLRTDFCVPPPPIPSLSGGWSLRPVCSTADLAVIRDWPTVSGEAPGRTGDAGRSSRVLLAACDSVPVLCVEAHRVVHHPLRDCYPVGAHDLVLEFVAYTSRADARELLVSLLPELTRAFFTADPRCRRITVAPDADRTAEIEAFLDGGFGFADEVDMPERTVVLLAVEAPRIAGIATALDAMPH